ncbi:MAG: hypothetical protein K2Y17_09395 [Qipengyuania sp.]|nr:hypothetical protein [Qipengyuania sp.]
MTQKPIPYERRRNPNLPWGYWCVAQEGKSGIRDEFGEEWGSLRSYLWFSRLGMGGSSNYGLEAQLELLLAVLAALARGVVAVEGLAKDLFLGGWEATRHYECWLVGHKLVKNGLSGGLTPEGHAILVMLASTRSAQSAAVPIGLPTIAPARGLDWGETRDERERVFAANEAFAQGLPNRFERVEAIDQPGIRLVGYPEGPNVPMARVLWSLAFREDHDRDRFYAWLMNRIDRWEAWADMARRQGAQQLFEHLLQLAHADRPALATD